MTRIVSAAFAALLAIAIAIPDAEAASRRLGGGKSVGTQREAVKQPPTAQPGQPAQAAPQTAPQPRPAQPAPAASGASKWLGPVAGLLAGTALGALLFGGAFAGIKFMDILMILLLAGAVFFIIRMLRKPKEEEARREPMQYASAGQAPMQRETYQPAEVGSGAAPAPAQPAGNYFPAGFDAESFAKHAKMNFIRMQEANDKADVAQLREMMTPALFAEIEAQLRERGNAPQKTEVVTLNAEVLEVVTERNVYVASVRFTGLIKEDPAAQPAQFAEIWHLEKPVDGRSGWLMSGIQQVQ